MPGMFVVEIETPVNEPYCVNKLPQLALFICGAIDAHLPTHSSPLGYVTENLPLFDVIFSAVATSTASLPFDNVKTKLQKMKRGPDGTFPYSGFFDCIVKTAAREGITGFWAGLPTFYFRVGPHSIVTLLAAEQLRKLMM